MPRATALVDAVRDYKKRLCLRYAPRHRVRKQHVLAVRYHAVQFAHNATKCGLEAVDTMLPTHLDMRPVELVVLPRLHSHLVEKIGRSWLASGCVQIKARHERLVDDCAAKSLLGFCEFLDRQCTESVVFFPPTDRDSHDLHAGLPGLVDKTCGVSSPEQLAEQDEHVSFPEQGITTHIRRDGIVHVFLHLWLSFHAAQYQEICERSSLIFTARRWPLNDRKVRIVSIYPRPVSVRFGDLA